MGVVGIHLVFTILLYINTELLTKKSPLAELGMH